MSVLCIWMFEIYPAVFRILFISDKYEWDTVLIEVFSYVFLSYGWECWINMWLLGGMDYVIKSVQTKKMSFRH